MAKVIKLSDAEVAELKRRRSAIDLREYLAMIAGFAVGDWGRLDLEPKDNRRAVKRRLTLAAKERGLRLSYRLTKAEDRQLVFTVV